VVRRLVATDETQLFRLTNSVRSELRRKGYRTMIKTVNEKDLFGNNIKYDMIHAISRDEKTIITIRLGFLGDKHRVHISAKTSHLEDLADKLEDIGYRVVDTEEELTASAMFETRELISKIKRTLETIS